MALPEDPRSPGKRDKNEDAVSLQSNPPSGESPEDSGKTTTPIGAETPPPAEQPAKTQSAEKDADELKPGEMVDKYRIEKMLGRGGMATVYKATDMQKQRVIALKVLKKKFSSSLKALARFDREFLALESLNHPNIVRVLDKGVEGGVNYFVMEYVDGASLSRILRHRNLNLSTKAQILLHVAAALSYAHTRGIVHRDVKPDNVLITRTGKAKLADFGIAQITRSQLPLTSITVTSSFMGTADYMAPEQRVDAKSVDHRADIFAFGVMLYETFTGKLPLGNFPLPSHLNSELSKRMDGIIMRALQQDPEDRYQTITELAEDLQRETQSTGLSDLFARLTLIRQTESWKKLIGGRTIGSIVIFGAIIGGIFWWYTTFGGSLPKLPGSDSQPGTKPGTGTTTGAHTTGPDIQQLLNTPENMAFVPAGEFIMGTQSEFSNERPRRKVYLDAYFIDKYEVTNAEYKKFVDKTNHRVPFVNTFWAEPYNWRNGSYPPGRGDYPVVLVSWDDAVAYAKWAGKRLPTEAEWEKAARGEDGRTWPWGDTWDVNKCNIQESFLNSPQPVDVFPEGKSPYDCFNMSGNVTEWAADLYSETYYRVAPQKNPPGPSTGSGRVARGGAWDSNLNLYARTGYRHYFPPDTRRASLGFRCVTDVQEE